MSKRRKRYRKIREQPNKVRFDEVRLFLVNDLEFIEISKRGSHVIFVHEKYEDIQITIPRPHGKQRKYVKRIYIKRMLEVLEQYNILVDYGLEEE